MDIFNICGEVTYDYEAYGADLEAGGLGNRLWNLNGMRILPSELSMHRRSFIKAAIFRVCTKQWMSDTCCELLGYHGYR